MIAITTPIVDYDAIHTKIDNLEKIIDNLTVLVENQQPSTTINNNDNLINIFLNEKYYNACNIQNLIAGIDLTNENYEKILRNYVGGKAEIIKKNYNNLHEFERLVYCFNGKDKHLKIAHFQHEKNWIVEPELRWERQVIREKEKELK